MSDKNTNNVMWESGLVDISRSEREREFALLGYIIIVLEIVSYKKTSLESGCRHEGYLNILFCHTRVHFFKVWNLKEGGRQKSMKCYQLN